MTLKKDKSGNCTGFAIVGMLRGSLSYDGSVDGEKPHFDPELPNDRSKRVGNNYSTVVGFDGAFPVWMRKAIDNNKAYEQPDLLQPPALKPAGDNL
jgi:hypothetical protein